MQGKCINDLRHTEYYHMQQRLDELYDSSLQNHEFTNLMSDILSDENILLAYRNMRSNTGSTTAGTDGKTIKDIAKLEPEVVIKNVRYYMTGSVHGYRPKPVRRKDIPKPNGGIRPLGIPCIWDRLIQQCVKQIMEPICEAKFSDNSYGFRPDRSVENAMASVYRLLQKSHMCYVVEFDIKGFFDNVNHSKLIKQIWTMGIHDKTLIYIIKQMLKCPIKLQDGSVEYPTKGTPQGGILSPLLANIVLNELDHWVDSQWERNPVIYQYSTSKNKSGGECFSNGYAGMRRKSNLKEIHIVRYADDFRIFCKTYEAAQRVLYATKAWLKERLKLDISDEKTRIVDVKNHYSEFLGFKMKLKLKSDKLVVQSHVSDKAMSRITHDLVEQAKNVAYNRKGHTARDEIVLYNQMVLGIHNYYNIATDVNLDFQKLKGRIHLIFLNRMKTGATTRYVKCGRPLTESERKYYGKSNMIRYDAETKEPIYPIGYVQHKSPIHKRKQVCRYTVNGRQLIHDNVSVNANLMYLLSAAKSYGRSIEYMDNRVSLYSAQKGKCAVTGYEFLSVDEIHCHHKIMKSKGGTDNYSNLVLILNDVHILIHAVDDSVIQKYLNILHLTKKQIEKVNQYRELIGNKPIL